MSLIDRVFSGNPRVRRRLLENHFNLSDADKLALALGTPKIGILRVMGRSSIPLDSLIIQADTERLYSRKWKQKAFYKHLMELADMDIIERVGKGAATFWKLTSAGNQILRMVGGKA